MNNPLSITFMELMAFFVLGFTFFIACFDTKMAMGYFLFIVFSSFLTMILKYLKEVSK